MGGLQDRELLRPTRRRPRRAIRHDIDWTWGSERWLPQPVRDEGDEMSANELESELKELIVEALMLEDVSADEIESDQPLFGDGLGLDSIDALELAMAVDKKYGVRIKADDEQNRQIFSSVKSLAAYVGQHRAA
jgi:acyl carrier protein